MSEKVRAVIKPYVFFPVAVWIVVNTVTYYLSRKIVSLLGIPYHSVETVLDSKIPFFAPFIVIYILAYVQWAATFLYIITRSKDAAYRFIAAETAAKLISFLIFIVFPTVMERPEISGGGFFEWLTSVIYSADRPDNLFPSIHCLESWFCFRALKKYTDTRPRFVAAEGVFTFLVFLSVVFVKQHMFLDIIGGIAVAEIGLFISEKFRFYRLVYKSEPPFLKNRD